jgi:hypothetical protein
MKIVTMLLAMGLLLAAAWAQSAATSEPTSASGPTSTASTEPTTAASEPTTEAATEQATSTSTPATAATTEPAEITSQPSVAATTATHSPVAKGPTTRPAATFDDYRIVLERNIFLKDRTPQRRPVFRPIRPAPTQPAPHQLVLTGVAIRQEIRVAFFEDDQTGELVKAVVGDVVQGGKLASISLDGVEFSRDNKTRKVAIGEGLLGGSSVDMSSAPSSETTAGPAGSSSSGDDILERMKKRRAKELKP